MRPALPLMSDDLAGLQQRLPHAHEGRKRPRLHRLDLLASGQAQTRGHAAQLWGVHRQTIGHWLARYETGGLEALLDVSIPAGTPLSRPPEVLAAREQALRQPAGLASYEARRQGVQQSHHREGNDHTLYPLVRTTRQAKRTVPRPRHTKTPGGHPGMSRDLSGAAGTRHSA